MRKSLALIFGILLLSILGAMFLTGAVSAAKFNIGDTVEVYNTGASGLKVRYPDACSSSYVVKSDGNRSSVLSGPYYCDDYYRWKIRWSDGFEGWSAEDWLRKVSITPSTKFSIGNRVKVNANGVNVRNDPPELAYFGSVNTGDVGTVVAGPFYGVPKGSSGFYYFWKIDYDTKTDGWTAENYLDKVIQCQGTDTSCGTTSCVNCNNNDGCSGDYYRNYYCSNNSAGCSYTSDNCNDCSCSCGGYNTQESTANGNCNDGKDNDCDGSTDSSDSGCYTCTPKTCSQLGKSCGSWDDGCGSQINCGSCPSGQFCDNGVCKTTQDVYKLPATSGKVSYFCDSCCDTSAWGVPLGPNCGTDDATKYWFVAMRWPYYDPCTGFSDSNAKSWWHNKKILVTNPSNGKQVVLAVKDWGPCNSCIPNCPVSAQNRVIDVSKTALDSLGAVTDDILNIEFADENAPLGPVGAGHIVKPPIVSRNEWGCPDGQSSPRWSPQYQSVTHIIIHHTATPNTDTNWSARVKQIWDYHANQDKGDGYPNGWGDIGYNYLIDPNGVIYEGRAGGDDVIGAHTGGYNVGTMGVAFLGTFSNVEPTSAALQSAKSLIAWKLNQKNINPLGSGTNNAKYYNYIAGHRDVSPGNECPGQKLYEILPTIRQDVWNIINSGISDNLPNVNAFSVSPSSVVLGNSFIISYTVSDDIGLLRAELWRADDSNGQQVNWNKIKESSISGKSYSGSFTDAPVSTGSYWYGLHVMDNSGNSENWNDERNSRTGFLPGVYGPIKVAVVQCTSGQTKCEGYNYYECVNNAWVNQGIVKGKCGVECLQKSECGSDSYIGSRYCVGDSVKQKYRTYSCSSYKCSYVETENTIENCQHGCSNGNCVTVTCPPGWNSCPFPRPEVCTDLYDPVCADNTKTYSNSCYACINLSINCYKNGLCQEGDVNWDNKVNIFDLAAVGLAYGSSSEDDNWNQKADLSGNGKVDIFDLATVGLNYGRSC